MYIGMRVMTSILIRLTLCAKSVKSTALAVFSLCFEIVG